MMEAEWGPRRANEMARMDKVVIKEKDKVSHRIRTAETSEQDASSDVQLV